MQKLELRVSLLQLDIVWENVTENLAQVEKKITENYHVTDLFVLPEMFTTGFSMNSRVLAETNDGKTIRKIKELAQEFGVAICGSFIAEDNGNYYNRGFFITPYSEDYYDKRHLFRMGDEANHFSTGNKRLVVNYRGFNISLIVCYDLRFPIWIRNVENEYDLLICVANWPIVRSRAWNTLLEARAIENMSYVCGVNRVGVDGNGLGYVGDSKIIDPKGIMIASSENKTDIISVNISKDSLMKFRNKFPVWKDADEFKLL